MSLRRCMVFLLAAVLAGCATTPPPATANARRADIAMLALSLVDTGYRFGGRNPEAGLDCSGMVAYVFDKSGAPRLTGSAADMARKGRQLPRDRLQAGDLVFFNTLDRPRSHVGIYLGDGRFVHAPASDGRVRIDSLDRGWFASRFEEGRSYLD